MAEQKCLVIGAAGGIGRELVTRLHDAGWRLVLAGRTEASLRELAGTVDGDVAVVDAADFDAVDNLFRDHAGVCGAVNLAGSILLKPAHLSSASYFDAVVSQNLKTAFAVTRAAGKHMRPAGGSVVLLSSCAASTGLANHELIAAAKAGVEGLVRSAAASYAAGGLRFNAVTPGLIDTPLAARITGNETALKASVAMHPAGRIGTAAEVASAIAFLLDPRNAFVTGQVLGVDGGLARLKTR